jgi:hypothetical protein
MTTNAMVLLLNSAGKHLELRNSADETILPATELKSGEDVRAAAKRAADEFFGLVVPEDSIREGFQSRVGNDVIAVYPVDVSKMDMSLLRPAEEAATWAWRDVPESMGHVVALGFPRNQLRFNAAFDDAMCPACKDEPKAIGKRFCSGCCSKLSLTEKLKVLNQNPKENATDILNSLTTCECGHDETDHAKNGSQELADFPNAIDRKNHIEKLSDGKYRLLSHEGKNLGTFDSHEAAAKHEGEVQGFKERGNGLVHDPHGRCAIKGCDKGERDGKKLYQAANGTYYCEDHAPAEVKKTHGDETRNDLDAGSHGHEYPGTKDGPFPVVRCNGADTVATQETVTDWRCEKCGEVISGPPKAAQVLDA